MVRARASPYCLVVMALLACCLSTAPGQESKTWLQSLRHCEQHGSELATPSNGGLDPPKPPKPGIYWVGALVSVTEWVWGRGDPLYRFVGCQGEMRSRGHDLGVANEAGACFHQCSGYRFVALKGTMCYCLDNGNSANDDRCTKPCYRNPNNTCGGKETYSIYSLNLLNSKTIAMKWTSGHETAATFDSQSDAEWWIVPTPRSNTSYVYCYRKGDSCPRGCIALGKLDGIAWPYKKYICKDIYSEFKDMILNSSSPIVLKLHGRSTREYQGWIFLSRGHFTRWIQGTKTEQLPPVGETELGPLCGALIWNNGTRAFNWENCNANHSFLCSPEDSGTPSQPTTSQPTASQPESGDLQITYVAAGGAGGIVFLGAVILSICLCRKRAGRQGGGSKAVREKPMEQGRVASSADVPQDPYPDGGHYDLMAEDGAVCTVYKNVSAGSSGSTKQQIEPVEDEFEGNYACVDAPPKANPLPVQKEASSASTPSPAPAADDADSCMYAVVQKPTYQNAPARQKAEPEKATPPLEKEEVKPSEDLYACVKK